MHSAYARGAVATVIIATHYIYIFGAENWHWISVAFTLMAITARVLYTGVGIGYIRSSLSHRSTETKKHDKGAFFLRRICGRRVGGLKGSCDVSRSETVPQ